MYESFSDSPIREISNWRWSLYRSSSVPSPCRLESESDLHDLTSPVECYYDVNSTGNCGQMIGNHCLLPNLIKKIMNGHPIKQALAGEGSCSLTKLWNKLGVQEYNVTAKTFNLRWLCLAEDAHTVSSYYFWLLVVYVGGNSKACVSPTFRKICATRYPKAVPPLLASRLCKGRILVVIPRTCKKMVPEVEQNIERA